MASLTEMAAARGKTVEKNTFAQIRVQQIHYTKLKPSDRNFYGQYEIDEMADSIALAGIIQPLIVRKTDMDEYEVIVGHRRRLASIRNVERGMKECEFLPCIEVKASDSIIQEIKELSSITDREAEDIFTRYILIASNSTSRELTNYERMEQAMELKEIIPYMRGDKGLKGRALRTEIAKEMKCSNGTVGTYESIYNNLIPKAMDRFKNDDIGISVAAGLASLTKEQQELLAEKEDISLADIKLYKEPEQIPGQMTTEDIAVSESDTEETHSTSEQTKAENNLEEEISTPEITALTDENIEQAISLIFDSDAGPVSYEEFEKIIELFSDGNDGHTGYMAQQLAFNKLLPLEDEYVKAEYECGYKITFKKTNEYMRVPVYHFWRIFEKYYRWQWEKKNTEQTVSESDTEEIPSKSEQNRAETEKTVSEFDTEDNNKTVSDSDTKGQQGVYTEFIVKTYKKSGMLYEVCETLEDMYKYMQDKLSKYDDVEIIQIKPSK